MTLVVAFPYGTKDRSALHLAGVLARSSGDSLRIVSVVPAPSRSPIPTGRDLQFAAWSRQRGDKAVAEARQAVAEICPDVRSEALYVASRSKAKALLDEAVASDAAMIIVGSGTDGGIGRISVSSTADRLLHSSPVPVALAPRGYRADGDARVTRVTCAFRGDPASHDVLARTTRISEEVGAQLRVATFGIEGQNVAPFEHDEQARRIEYEEQVKSVQTAALEVVTAEQSRPAEEVVGTGRTWTAALDSLDWVPTEVLVVGSSSEGGATRLFLGSNASRIIRHTPVPVVLVP
ncbi:universal stress protein [Kocuria coralli]|uniref:Universal stress protein n=1 Tax=Kocuria coralli TaxID=1461025 RepID=A0A5J5KXV8_9MICC|nr:universal stress protein [Kocuria coralli]KAA9394484.1 universal stress protein [Kocuria coralli]